MQTRRVESIMAVRGEEIVSGVLKEVDRRAKATFKSMNRNAQRTTTAMGKVKGAIREWATPINQGLELFNKLGRAIDVVEEHVSEGARSLDLGARYADTIQNASRHLEGLRESTRKTIDDTWLKQMAMRMHDVGFGAEHMGEAMRMGWAIADRQGRDTRETIEQMSVAIATGRQQSIQALGLTMDMKQVYADYADELGTTASNLSEAQKRQARLNEMMEIGKEKFGDTDAIHSHAEAVQQVATEWHNAKSAMQEGLALLVTGDWDTINRNLAKLSFGGALLTEYAWAPKERMRKIAEDAAAKVRAAQEAAAKQAGPEFVGGPSAETTMRLEFLESLKVLEKAGEEAKQRAAKRRGGGGRGGGRAEAEASETKRWARITKESQDLILAIERQGLENRQRLAEEQKAWKLQLDDWHRENMMAEVEEHNAAQMAKIDAEWEAWEKRQELHRENIRTTTEIVVGGFEEMTGLVTGQASQVAAAFELMWSASSPEQTKKGISGLLQWGAAALKVLGIESWVQVAYHTAEGIAALIPPATNPVKAAGHFAAAAMFGVAAARAGRGGGVGRASVGGGYGGYGAREPELTQVGGERPAGQPAAAPKTVVHQINGDVYLISGAEASAADVGTVFVRAIGAAAETGVGNPWEEQVA